MGINRCRSHLIYFDLHHVVLRYCCGAKCYIKLFLINEKKEKEDLEQFYHKMLSNIY
jgi:hypothetical protein